MTKINIEQICSINRHDKLPNYDWKYQKPRTLVMWYDRKPNLGGYTSTDSFLGSPKELLSEQELLEKNDNVYVENNIVYWKPRLSFRMSSQQYFTKYFESVQELEQFLKEEVLFHIKTINI